MLTQIAPGLRRAFRARHGPITASQAAPDIRLERRALYILPTREGLYYGAMLAVMLLAAVIYANGLAYALTFMLAAVSVVATLHTHRNLSGLRITAGSVSPVFAGESAVFTIVLHNDSPFARQAVDVSSGDQSQRVTVPAHSAAAVEIPVLASRRGYVTIPPLKLRTRFPVGLWHAWSRAVQLPARSLVYPRPAREQSFPNSPGLASAHEGHGSSDGEDFSDLREYRHGDPMQRVAWKKAAAGHGWYTKQFQAPALQLIWLEWNALAPMPTEQRLQLFCRWVLMAEQQGIAYGVRMPGATIPPAIGSPHRECCLERLALYEAPT